MEQYGAVAVIEVKAVLLAVLGPHIIERVIPERAPTRGRDVHTMPAGVVGVVAAAAAVPADLSRYPAALHHAVAGVSGGLAADAAQHQGARSQYRAIPYARS